MLDFNAPEFLIVGIVALLVIGPKDLPKAMRFVGKWVGKARRVANQFRSGLDNMVRESELAELEKKWAEENARIMREHPPENYTTTTTTTTTAADRGAPETLLPAPQNADPAWGSDGTQPVYTTPAPEMFSEPAPEPVRADEPPLNPPTPTPAVDGKPQP